MKGAGGIWGDYDNDGDLDIYAPVGNGGTFRELNMLERNDRGVFRVVSEEAGLTNRVPSDNAIWLDYDRDGWLDLYVGNSAALENGESNPDMRNRLYRNLGDGTFADVTAQAGLDVQIGLNGGSVRGMVAADFDGDDWPDLFLAARSAPNRLFLNNGDGTFRDASGGDLDDRGFARDLTVADIDNDGDLDLFVTSFKSPQNDLPFRSQLLLNLGQGQFLDITEGAGLVELAASRIASLGAGDIDNDGDIDLLFVDSNNRQYLRFYLNNGDLTFSEASARTGIERPDLSALSLGDYDLDGFLDVFLTQEFASSLALPGQPPLHSDLSRRPGGLSPPALFRNRGNANHYLRVELVGIKSSRNGIGARIVATAGDLVQTRQIIGGTGVTQDEMIAHFGLGAQQRVERLEVFWPSGQVDMLENLAADQKIRLVEGTGTYHAVQPTIWTHSLPDSLEPGAAFALDIDVRPALFDAGATVTADLSRFGGGEAVPLVHEGDAYRLSTTLTALRQPGLYELSVTILQETSAGPYWTQLSAISAVLPVQDQMIFDDGPVPNWRMVARHHAQLDPESTMLAHSGNSSQAITLQPEGTAFPDTILYLLEEPGKEDRALWQQRRGWDRLNLVNPPPPPEPLRSSYLFPPERAGLDLCGYTHLSFFINPAQAQIDSLFIEIGGQTAINPTMLFMPVEVSLGPRNEALHRAIAGAVQFVDGEQVIRETVVGPRPGGGLALFLSLILDPDGQPTENIGPGGALGVKAVAEGGFGRRFMNQDLSGQRWIPVHVSLDSLRGWATDLRLPFVRLRGNVRGTFYIDEMRLTRNPPGAAITAVLESRDASTPQSFALQQNYPNPFNSGTVIRFALPSDEQVELTLYNLAGQQVATLVTGRRQAGSYAVSWDGQDESGRALATGLYFYRLQAGEKVETRKLMLLR